MTQLNDPVVVMMTALYALVVLLLLAAERSNSARGVWLSKPLASTLFIAIALLAGALESTFGILILLGLAMSWLGDVFLIPRGRVFFVLGLASFLLAHLAYASAFFLQPLAQTPLIVATIIMVVFAAVVLRWLWPHVPPNLKLPVTWYLAAISLMVVMAIGTMPALGPVLVMGAVLFAVSDLFVARHRFIAESVTNRLWGLPLYYAAQLLFALNVAAT